MKNEKMSNRLIKKNKRINNSYFQHNNEPKYEEILHKKEKIMQ